jgi:hypothetical protein
MEKQRKTFLSYSRVNKDFAIKLARELKSEGFDIWLDLLDIPAGSRWDREIEKALRECEIFMVILTPASIESENVLDEIGFAMDGKKRLLPVLLEKCEIPFRLKRIQYIDFTNKEFNDGVESAKDLLRSLMAQPTLPKVALSEQERIATQKADDERLTKTKAESARKAKQQADLLAAQEAEQERLANQKAEEERVAKARADADRKTNAEAKRRVNKEAEHVAARADEKQEEFIVPATGVAQPIAPAIPQKQASSRGLLIGIVGIVALGCLAMGIRAILSSGPPAATEEPVYSDAVLEAPAATEEPVIVDEATAAPAAEEVATEAPADKTVFYDDFSDPDLSYSNWDSSISFADGVQYMTVPDNSNYSMSSPYIDFAQYGSDLGVVSRVYGVPDGRAGVYCRFQDAGFYVFFVDFNDSTARAWYNDFSNWEFLMEQPVSAAEEYWLVAECYGSSLRFYVNGEVVIEVEDGRLADPGIVGLYFESVSPSGSTIAVEDFAVYYP